jgi:SAM-dependent methyltransferase
VILFDGTVPVDYHQFLIVVNGWPDPDEESLVAANGLVEVRSGGLTVLSGAQYGDIGLRVEGHPAEPDLDLDDWDEVVDVSVDVSGELLIHELMGGPVVPDIAFDGPGTYRLRCCARGRELGQPHAYDDPPAESPWERHAVLLWPAPAAPARVHKLTDRVGAGFSGEPDGSAPPPAPGYEAALRTMERLITAVAAEGDPEPAGTAEAEVTAVLDASPRKVFAKVRALHWWLGRGGIPAYAPGQDFTVYLVHDAIYLWGSMRAVPARGRMEFDMAWANQPPDWREVPRPRTTVLLRVEKHGGGTLVSVSHRRLPAGWAGDVAALWRYYLARLARMVDDEVLYVGSHPWDPERTG